MSEWPDIAFGNTGLDAAFTRADVYDVADKPDRSAKRPLSVAIAGFGGVAQAKWLPAIRRLQTVGEPVSLVGVTEPDPARRMRATTLTGAPARATLDQLLVAERPDLLLVLAADVAHFELARTAIERGTACLVEKPLCPSADDADRLVRLAEEKGVLLAAVANKRFSPPYALARSLIDRGALKAPPTVFAGKFTLGYPYVDLLDGGTVHLLDLMRWFMGPIDRLHARGLGGPDGRLASAVVSLRFASNAIGTVMTSAAGLSFKPWERVEIFGRNAFLVVDDQHELTLYDDETGPAKSWRPVVPNTLTFDESFGGYAGQLENVLDALRGTAPLAVTGRDGAAAVRLIAAIRRSLTEAAEITVSDPEIAS
jgi:predicted dehydrogenase